MKKILVIEDNFELRDGIRDYLEAEDYEVIDAADGLEGLRKAKEYLPDLIVCDITMPKLDGYKVLSSLKQNSSTSLIPFIFLTSKAERTDQREGMELGADDYLTKPFTRDELLRALHSVFVKRENLLERIGTAPLERKAEDFVMLRIADKPKLVQVDDIKAINANGDYSEVILDDKTKSLVLRTLKEWEDKLPANFIRIHRATIINVSYIDKIEDWSNYTYRIYIKGIEVPFTASQKYSIELKKRFS